MCELRRNGFAYLSHKKLDRRQKMVFLLDDGIEPILIGQKIPSPRGDLVWKGECSFLTALL